MKKYNKSIRREAIEVEERVNINRIDAYDYLIQ